MLSVNAEEEPAKIYNDSINMEEWRFDVEYVKSLANDFTENREEWENVTIPDYLE